MLKYIVGCLCFTLSSLVCAQVQKYCLENNHRSVKFIESTNIGSAAHAVAKNKAMEAKSIVVRDQNDGEEVLFSYTPIQAGDCLLLDVREAISLEVKHDQRLRKQPQEDWRNFFGRWGRDFVSLLRPQTQQLLYPIVHFSAADGGKRFGLIEKRHLNLFQQVNYSEDFSAQALMNQDVPVELTVIYILCPRERDEVCRLQIKHKGAWVKQGNQTFSLPLLARSNRQSANKQHSYRIFQSGDAPQGVYFIWASMFTTQLIYGAVPRLDLDAAYPPPNAHPYAQHSYLLSKLVPKEHHNEYWMNEWPLGYALGRVFLRFHANSKDPGFPDDYRTPVSGMSFRTTHGCLNFGDQMQVLIDKLVEIGAVRAQDLDPAQSSTPLSWKITPDFGKLLLVLKDQ